MLYYLHEMHRLAMLPARAAASNLRAAVNNPMNPWSYSPMARTFGAAADMFEQMTRRYGRPEWAIETVDIGGKAVQVTVEPVIRRTYGHLVHFRRDTDAKDPRLLIVAPLSGHFATLLRGTVEGLLPNHDVYITDWQDCRMIPLAQDRFNLSDYIDYVIDFLHYLGPNTHVLAVCQPSVPVLAATAIMSGWGDDCVPATLTLIGGPIDTRENPTAVNKLAQEHDMEWFEKNVVTTVPLPYPGAGRLVYPGFLQLTNFISMNLDKHMESLGQLFDHLVQGDEESAEKKQAFYDEYLAVMDLPGEFYLETVKTVFQDHALPKGEMTARWQPVMPDRIRRTAILCIEGELDDICGVGQTKAALKITPNVPDAMKAYHLQKGAGHYGVFNGGKFKRDIVPKISAFIRDHDRELKAAKRRKLKAEERRDERSPDRRKDRRIDRRSAP